MEPLICLAYAQVLDSDNLQYCSSLYPLKVPPGDWKL